ncbi:MAG TPA: sugar phosphate isomerase/epimerase [Candidatus Acidoferrum sp.]|nr:sugar phosphate isomerase/epimerase [Candidatus Acidoferrum sp.]
MLTRRRFLQSSLAALTGAAATARRALASAQPIGVQLYTVRTLTQRDLPGLLGAIRKIGYEEVETYWDVYTHPAAELKRMINDHGLRVPSGHFNYDGLEGKLDYAKTLGVEYVICPMLPPEMQTSLDGFKRAADQFNKWGEQIKGMGMRLGFHTHNYEFHRFGKTTGFETLMERTDPNLMCVEIDCYWVTEAGRDPVQMIRQLGRRVRLLHMKDRKAGFPTSTSLNAQAEHFTPVGTGTIDWKAVIAAAKRDGIEHFFVEQDSGPPAPLECLRISYKNLRPLV